MATLASRSTDSGTSSTGREKGIDGLLSYTEEKAIHSHL